jgi:hypothetical protein
LVTDCVLWGKGAKITLHKRGTLLDFEVSSVSQSSQRPPPTTWQGRHERQACRQTCHKGKSCQEAGDENTPGMTLPEQVEILKRVEDFTTKWNKITHFLGKDLPTCL